MAATPPPGTDTSTAQVQQCRELFLRGTMLYESLGRWVRLSQMAATSSILSQSGVDQNTEGARSIARELLGVLTEMDGLLQIPDNRLSAPNRILRDLCISPWRTLAEAAIEDPLAVVPPTLDEELDRVVTSIHSHPEAGSLPSHDRQAEGLGSDST